MQLRRIFATSLAVVALTACGGQGSNTDCNLQGCTITFQRDGTATVSVLGISAELVGVQDGVAQLEVAGQTVSVPVGGETQAEGFTVSVVSVTDAEVVVRVTQ